MTLSQSWNPLSPLILLAEGRKCEFCGWYFSHHFMYLPCITSHMLPRLPYLFFIIFYTSSFYLEYLHPFTLHTLTPSPHMPPPSPYVSFPYHLCTYPSYLTYLHLIILCTLLPSPHIPSLNLVLAVMTETISKPFLSQLETKM